MAQRLDIEIIKGDTYFFTYTRYAPEYMGSESTWTDLVNYKYGDVVLYRNNTYICTVDTTNQQIPTDTNFWVVPPTFDYSGCTFSAQIKTDHDEEQSIINFTVIKVTDGSDGQIQLTLSANITAALNFETGVYDLEVTQGTTVWKEFYGKVTVKDEVTV